MIFFGDKKAEAAYGAALQRWSALGATLVEFDLKPLYEPRGCSMKDRGWRNAIS